MSEKVDFLVSLNNWISSLNPQVFDSLKTIVSGIFTLLVAFFGIRATFRQIQSQFEHKMIYEGWVDFQKKLFEFNSALGEYDFEILSLKYFIDNQDNEFFNNKNKSKFRFDKWKKITDLNLNMQKAYVDFLKAFETHEVIFIGLQKMKSLFQNEMRKKLLDQNMDFFKTIFPEMYGVKQNKNNDEIKEIISKHWTDATEVGAYLDDFRVELQNTTLGKVIKSKVPHRKPKLKGMRVLTVKGFIKS